MKGRKDLLPRKDTKMAVVRCWFVVGQGFLNQMLALSVSCSLRSARIAFGPTQVENYRDVVNSTVGQADRWHPATTKRGKLIYHEKHEIHEKVELVGCAFQLDPGEGELCFARRAGTWARALHVLVFQSFPLSVASI